jgi:hypothetical protein
VIFTYTKIDWFNLPIWAKGATEMLDDSTNQVDELFEAAMEAIRECVCCADDKAHIRTTAQLAVRADLVPVLPTEKRISEAVDAAFIATHPDVSQAVALRNRFDSALASF